MQEVIDIVDSGDNNDESSADLADFDDGASVFLDPMKDNDADMLAEHVRVASVAFELGPRVTCVGRQLHLKLSLLDLSGPTQEAIGVSEEGRLSVEIKADQGYRSNSPVPQISVHYIPLNSDVTVTSRLMLSQPSFPARRPAESGWR